MGYYIIKGHLRFRKSLGKNCKNILNGEYQKEGIKYEGGMKPFCPLRSSPLDI